METRQVFIVDACAAEPTGGVPVAVLSEDGLTDDQLRAVADELAATVAVPEDDSLRIVGTDGSLDTPPTRTAATVGTLGHQYERGEREADEYAISTPAGTLETEVTTDGGVWVRQDQPTVSAASVDESRVATALGIDPAAIRDVGADLPPMVLSAGVDALAVPVNFLEHVSHATADPSTLGAVAEDADVDAVCAFTFDTLAADAACHLRTFVPPGRRLGRHTVNVETPAFPALAGGLVSTLFERGIIEDATTSVEQGHFLDRPGRIHVEADSGLRVGGHTVTSLDGSVTVPADEDDDIIEV